MKPKRNPDYTDDIERPGHMEAIAGQQLDPGRDLSDRPEPAGSGLTNVLSFRIGPMLSAYQGGYWQQRVALELRVGPTGGYLPVGVDLGLPEQQAADLGVELLVAAREAAVHRSLLHWLIAEHGDRAAAIYTRFITWQRAQREQAGTTPEEGTPDEQQGTAHQQGTEGGSEPPDGPESVDGPNTTG